MKQDKKLTYRIEGMNCPSCATTFERKVKELPGVTNAKVNFGASTLTIYGETTREQLNRAGAFDGIRVIPQNDQIDSSHTPFWKNPSYQRVFASSILLLLGWLLDFLHEETILVISLYVLSILLGGTPLFVKGLRSLSQLQFDMNTLMTIAILGAAAIGEWKEGAAVVILFAIGEALEAYSMDKARQSIRSLITLAPKHALIRKDKEEIYCPVDDIEIGDIMIVKPGEKLAMDGIVTKGTSFINEAPITGESMPIGKTISDEVFAGTLNGEGALEITVTKRVEDTTLAKIIYLVEEAQAERAPSQTFIDRFAKIYTPAILIIAILLSILPPLLLNGNFGEWFYRGLALLVVGCPCALVVSTPLSIVTAIGNAARNGVLIKGGVYLEESAALSIIAFDKTGTLTQGTPEVTDILSIDQSKQRHYLRIAAALEKNAQHPVATAIIRRADQESINYIELEIDDFTTITGMGITATIQGTVYYIGNPTLYEKYLLTNIPQQIKKSIESLQNQGKTVMILGTKNEIAAIIGVADEVRKNSSKVLQQLSRLGIKKTIILTGDNKATAETIRTQLGIDEAKANLLPQEKRNAIHRLQESGVKIAMVGDGINDAPALAAASVGIAMGKSGTDAALETADIILMKDDLEKLPFIIELSRATLRIIKQNITLSLALKGIALLLIIPGWLTLWMAVIADMGATLLVTLNSLRLINHRK